MDSIALIAHNEKKQEMIQFVRNNLQLFRNFHLIATETTGTLLETLGLKIKKTKSGPHGGDAQIAAMLVNEEINGLFFLRDPLTSHPHGPDIFMLLRLADVHNIPTATNLASAQILIHGLFISSHRRPNQSILLPEDHPLQSLHSLRLDS